MQKSILRNHNDEPSLNGRSGRGHDLVARLTFSSVSSRFFHRKAGRACALRKQMAIPFKTAIAAAMLVVPLGTSLAGASELSAGVQKSIAPPATATRILETRQATQPPAINVMASPALLAHWVDEQRGRHVAIGLTIFR